jgi:hypothetical protein
MRWHTYHDPTAGWFWWTDDLGRGWKAVVHDMDFASEHTLYRIMAIGCCRTEITLVSDETYATFAEAKRAAVLYAMEQRAIGVAA